MRLFSGTAAIRALAPATPPPHRWWPLDSGPSLRSWLWDESRKWAENDKTFVAQRAIGLAELGGGPEYRELQRRHEQAERDYYESSGRQLIEIKEQSFQGGEKAIAGLRAFVDGGSEADDEATRARRERAVEKLQGFASTDEERRDQLAAAHAACPEWLLLRNLTADLDAAQKRLGVPALEKQAASLLRKRGKEASKGGRAFEQAAGSGEAGASLSDAILRAIRDDPAALDKDAAPDLILLNGVTLGMSRAEIDYLVCTPRTTDTRDAAGGRQAAVAGGQMAGKSRGVLVDAVAFCEVKRDCSDMGNAVVKSAETMAWLAGVREAYEPECWINKIHPSGHFGVQLSGDREAELKHCHTTSDGDVYVFDQRSFRAFREDARRCGAGGGGDGGVTLPSRLHIVTSSRRAAGSDTLRPLPSKPFGKLQKKAARDLALLEALMRQDAADSYDWDGLLDWVGELKGRLSAYEALQLFAADASTASRLHVEVSDEWDDEYREALEGVKGCAT